MRHWEKRLVELRDDGKTAGQTAEILNAEGFVPIDPRSRFNREIVPRLPPQARPPRRIPGRLIAGARGMVDPRFGPGSSRCSPGRRCSEWAIKGWVQGHQTKVQKLWIVRADKEEIKRLLKLRATNPHGTSGYPKELTTSKRRPAPVDKDLENLDNHAESR